MANRCLYLVLDVFGGMLFAVLLRIQIFKSRMLMANRCLWSSVVGIRFEYMANLLIVLIIKVVVEIVPVACLRGRDQDLLGHAVAHRVVLLFVWTRDSTRRTWWS